MMNHIEEVENVPEAAVREQLDRVLSSTVLKSSERLGGFLRFIVERVLAGEAGSLKEYIIGIKVYERERDFDPSQESIVRTEARRLRSKLKDYYDGPGASDPVTISLTPGSYAPKFHFHSSASTKTENNLELFAKGSGVTFAVIPFVDLTSQPRSKAFAKHLTEEVTHNLMRTDGCRVLSPGAVGHAVSKEFDIPVLAEKFAVQFVLEGTVREEANVLRSTLQVINADGFHLWSVRFDVNVEGHDHLELAEQIATAFIYRIRFELSPIRRRSLSIGPLTLTALPMALAGESALDDPPRSDISTALNRFHEAEEAAPTYARAHSGIALSHCERVLRGEAGATASLPQAFHSASRAVELDPYMIGSRTALAMVHALQWNGASAEAEFEMASSLGEHPCSYRAYGLYLTSRGRYAEGWDYLERSQQIDPFSTRQKVACARYFLLSRGYDAVAAHFASTPQAGPLPPESIAYMGIAHALAGRAEAAVQAAEDARRHSGADRPTLSTIAEVFALAGVAELAERIVRSFDLLSTHPGISPYRQALLFLALGRDADGLSALEIAYRERDGELIWLAGDPRFDRLRPHRRFQEIESLVGMGQPISAHG